MTTLPAKLSTLKDLVEISVDSEQIKEPKEIEEALKPGVPKSLTIKRILREKLHNSQPNSGLKLMIVGTAVSNYVDKSRDKSIMLLLLLLKCLSKFHHSASTSYFGTNLP